MPTKLGFYYFIPDSSSSLVVLLEVVTLDLSNIENNTFSKDTDKNINVEDDVIDSEISKHSFTYNIHIDTMLITDKDDIDSQNFDHGTSNQDRSYDRDLQ